MNDIDNVVVSSRVRLARNVEGYPFPARLAAGDTAFTYNVLLPAVKVAIDGAFPYKYYDMAKLSDINKKALVEKHLVSPDLIMNADNGKAIVSEDETISIMINEEDHIRAQCVLRGYHLDKAYERINKIDDEISKHVHYAFDRKLGYLTSCPTNLGTGMRASAMMFLPGLTITGSINNFINTAGKLGLTARGIYGEGSEAEGYLYQISNEVSLGLSELDILRRVDTFVKKVAESEIKARQLIFSRENVALIDKIMRAYGVLTNAYVITSDEAMRLLSLVKLGVGGGIIKDINMETLNALTDEIGAGCICVKAGKALSSEGRDMERAKLLKAKLNK